MTALLASVAAGRSALYWLLADLFLICPNETLVARLSRDLPSADEDDMHANTRELAALRETLPREPSSIAALALEFTRLFGAIRRNGGPTPPAARSMPIAPRSRTCSPA